MKMRNLTAWTLTIVAAAVLVLGAGPMTKAATIGDPASWDLLDMDFGSDAGKTSVASNFTVLWGSLDETLTADSTQLLNNNSGFRTYPDVPEAHTYELRMAVPINERIDFPTRSDSDYTQTELRFFADGTIVAGNPWTAHLPAMPDITPAGFDRTVMNVYRIVVDGDGTASSTADLYLNNDGANPISIVLPNVNNAMDAVDIFNSTGVSRVDIDYIRLATGAYAPIPEPATASLLGIGLIVLLGYCRMRKR